MGVVTVYCSLILFVAVLPLGSIGANYTLEEMVKFFESLDNVNASLGEETVITANGETRVTELLGTVSELLTKHAQEAMMKMKFGYCCRTLRYTVAMCHFGSKILMQIQEITKKILKNAGQDVQKLAQDCAAVALSHTEGTKDNFETNLGNDIKEHIVGQIEPEEKAVLKVTKYSKTMGESAYKGYTQGAVSKCVESVSPKSVNNMFNELLEQELDASVKLTVADPENKELYKKESKKAANDATMALLQGKIAEVLQQIRETFHAVYPWVLIFHDGFKSNIEALNPETNADLKLPSTASAELKKQSEMARVMYNNVCIGKNISQDSIYNPLGEVNLQELNKETIPTKTLLGYQEKLKATILAETEILPQYWKSAGPFET